MAETEFGYQVCLTSKIQFLPHYDIVTYKKCILGHLDYIYIYIWSLSMAPGSEQTEPLGFPER